MPKNPDREAFKQLSNTLIKVSRVLEVFDEDRTESIMHSLLKWSMRRRRFVPLGEVAKFIRNIPLMQCPWPSANFLNREWFAFNFWDELRDERGWEVSDALMSDMFAIPKYSKGCGGRYDCINGTILLKRGLQYEAKALGWCPELDRVYHENCRAVEFEDDETKEVIRTDSLIEAVVDWDHDHLRRIVRLAKWDLDIRNYKDVNQIGDYLFTRLQVSLKTDAKRDPVKEWDAAVMAGPRFVTAFGSGSNIRVVMEHKLPRTKVKVCSKT